GLGRGDDESRLRVRVVPECEESRRWRGLQHLERGLHHARQARALDAGLQLRVVEAHADAGELLRLAVLVRDLEAHGDDAVADDAAARVRPGSAGLGEALAARAAEVTRRAVVRTVVTLLAALDGPVAAPRRRERLVDRLRDALRRRHRRVGHAGGQRITAPDVRSRQAGAGFRNLEGRLGDRLRSGVDARGIQRPERGRGLVEVRLTLRGVLHDLLEDRRPCLANRLDALGL